MKSGGGSCDLEGREVMNFIYVINGGYRQIGGLCKLSSESWRVIVQGTVELGTVVDGEMADGGVL